MALKPATQACRCSPASFEDHRGPQFQDRLEQSSKQVFVHRTKTLEQSAQLSSCFRQKQYPMNSARDIGATDSPSRGPTADWLLEFLRRQYPDFHRLPVASLRRGRD